MRLSILLVAGFMLCLSFVSAEKQQNISQDMKNLPQQEQKKQQQRTALAAQFQKNGKVLQKRLSKQLIAVRDALRVDGLVEQQEKMRELQAVLEKIEEDLACVAYLDRQDKKEILKILKEKEKAIRARLARLEELVECIEKPKEWSLASWQELALMLTGVVVASCGGLSFIFAAYDPAMHLWHVPTKAQFQSNMDKFLNY